MTRVDFYILADVSTDASMRFACVLGLRALKASVPVHIHTDDEASGKALDELMWDYPKRRFIPHAIVSDNTQAPIHIGWTQPELAEGLLINLATKVPPFFGRFDRVAEIIVEETKEGGRERYKHYRHRGYPIHDHQLSDWEHHAA